MRLPRALAIIGRSFYDLWDNVFVLIVVNLIWMACITPTLLFVLLPLPGVVTVLGVAILLTVFVGPPVMGVYALTADVTRYEKLELGNFWRSIKSHWRRGMTLVGLNIVALIVFVSDVLFYGGVGTNDLFRTAILTLSFLVYFVWLMMQLFVYPLAVRSQTTLPVLYRNALIATFKYPSLSLPLLFLVVVLAVIASLTVLIMILFGFVLIALISNRALSDILEHEAERSAPARTSDDTALAALAASEMSAGKAWAAPDPLQPAITAQSKDAQSIAASGVRRRALPPSQ